MTSKNVSLREGTYELISREKLPDESFLDTIERLVKRRGKLMDAVDSWEEIDEKEVNKIEENIERVRKKFISDMDYRTR
ncbi:MAG: antitoxin VapB family protein [Candidatus Natronoplasma sp.]